MKILFLHGWRSVPGGVKPTYMAQHGHAVINPALPDEDFAAAVQIAQAEFDKHQPQVVVGSSRGGAVAMNIACADARLVLLCPAWKRWGAAKTVKAGTAVLHSRADDVIPFAESEELVRNSGLPASSLIEVGTDHRLADPETLAAMLRACKANQGRMPPILVADLFPEITSRLLELLRSLSPDEWCMATISSRRAVKDIASHLLDGSLRRLSMQRDGYRPSDGRSQPRAGEPLMDFLNRLNEEWETGTRRLSPKVLTDLIEWADAQLADLFQSFDPHDPAIFPVAWAGEEQSENWMDVARDYTEKWHHTQQIFDATRRPSTIMTRRLGHPCLDIFMRALPFTFGTVEADPGTVVTVNVTGETGGNWHVERQEGGWRQVVDPPRLAAATVTMDQDTAWKLVTKRRNREKSLRQFPTIEITGDKTLGLHILDMVSVMA